MAIWCYFYCSCHENKWATSQKLIFMLKIHRLMVRILLPIRKGSGKEQTQETSKERKRHSIFCLLFWVGNKLSPVLVSPFLIFLGIRRDKQLAVLHLLSKFSVKSTPNQLLMDIISVREPHKWSPCYFTHLLSYGGPEIPRSSQEMTLMVRVLCFLMVTLWLWLLVRRVWFIIIMLWAAGGGGTYSSLHCREGHGYRKWDLEFSVKFIFSP